MSEFETRLEMAERHLRQSEAAVARQEELVARLIQHCQSYDLALHLLQQFRRTLMLHQDRFEQLVREHEISPPQIAATAPETEG